MPDVSHLPVYCLNSFPLTLVTDSAPLLHYDIKMDHIRARGIRVSSQDNYKGHI